MIEGVTYKFVVMLSLTTNARGLYYITLATFKFIFIFKQKLWYYV